MLIKMFRFKRIFPEISIQADLITDQEDSGNGDKHRLFINIKL
jgi:hypothetical protein